MMVLLLVLALLIQAPSARVKSDREINQLKGAVKTFKSERAMFADGKEAQSQITMDAGKAEGVLLGMELHSYDPPNSETAEIIEVHEHTSRARIVQVGTEGDKPKSGWRLSTRLIDNALPPK